MDIKLFSLCKQEVPESEKGKKCILDCVKGFFPEVEGFTAFTSQKRMLLAAVQSLQAADIVIIAVQRNMYHTTKRQLCDSLNIELEENETVIDMLSDKVASGKIKQTTFDTNIMIPERAEILPTDSGINNGFTLTEGGQHIIYLPIEAPRAEEVVYGSLYDYLDSIGESSTSEEAMEIRHSAIIERILEKFGENSRKVAVCSDFMQDFITSHIEEQKSVIFDNDIPEKESSDLKEYYINKARYIRDEHNAQYGIAFSKPVVCEGTEEKCILVAIADDIGANTVKVFAEEGEDDKKLFTSAVDKTLLMLYDYQEFVNSAENDSMPSEEDKLLRKAILKITACGIGASAVIGLITALMIK